MSDDPTQGSATTSNPTDPVRSKARGIAGRAVSRATDTTFAGAVVTLMFVYNLIPAEAMPPIQVILGVLFVTLKAFMEPTERRS